VDDAAQFDCGQFAEGVMNGFAIKGWCPSALRPMLSGDGLVVRIRPRGGRLTAAQASRIADLAERHGNGLIDLTGRANLQIRGVREDGHEPLVVALAELALVDPDEQTETRRNILVAPFWRAGDETKMLAAGLERALAERRLGLPEKFGFAVDCGKQRVLSHASADIRIERGAYSGLLVRADGARDGRTVAGDAAIATALALASWFVASGGARGGRGRMASHIASGVELPQGLAGNARPVPATASPGPGLYAAGALVGLTPGQLGSDTLKFLGTLAPGLRMTPWRLLLLEGVREMPNHDGVVTCADDPLLRVTACAGAPSCPEAHAETRTLAAALAPHIPSGSHLHVSGCAKGCAHPRPSAVTLVGTRSGFDLVRNGTTRDRPAMRALDRAEILGNPGALMGPR